MEINTKFVTLKLLLKKEPATDAIIFQRMLSAAMSILNLSDGYISEALDVSRATVSKWRNGTASPHPLTCTTVYELLVEECDKAVGS